MTNTAERTARMAEEKLKPKIELADAEPPEFSDEALAQRFAERHGDELRFIAKWSQWCVWAATRWEEDSTLGAFDKARAICRGTAADPDAKGRMKTDLTSAKTVSAVERLAKADRRIAATVEQWDAAPDVLNTEAMELGDDGGTTGGTTP